MHRRRVIKSVLHNFLGTYTSLSSRYQGFWLFGFLVEEIDQIRIGLLEPNAPGSSFKSVERAEELAIHSFTEQLEVAGVPKSFIQTAHIDIQKSSVTQMYEIDRRLIPGSVVTFSVEAISDLGKSYTYETCLFVAPHIFFDYK
jgi:hypothetical protein